MKIARKYPVAAPRLGKQILLTAMVACALGSTAIPLVAQQSTNALEKATPDETSEPPPYRPWAVGLGIGTAGIFGGGVSWRFADHLGARVGVGYAEGSWDDVGIAGTKYNARLQLLAEPLTVDVYPWKKSSFHVSLGIMFNQNELKGSATGDGTITLDGQTFTRAEVGSLHMKVEQKLVNPYLTIGGNLFYFDRAHHWAFVGELGVAYTGEPSVSLTRSGPASPAVDAALQGAEKRLENFANDYKWWPVLKLAVTYSF
jgi:hypothetical protein